MRYVLGLDIGITSVGWGVIDLDTSKPMKYGVRLFKEANAEENLKRRTARGARRLKRRRTNRLDDLKKLLTQYEFMDNNFSYGENPYQIRKRGLTEKLTKDELCTALLHIAKHRGNSLEVVEDNEDKVKENETTKLILKENDILIKKGLHVCEIQLSRLNERGYIRGNDNNFRTKDYEKEVIDILNTQGIEESIKQQILNCIIRKREYFEGPGSFISQSPYGMVYDEKGNVILNMIEKMTGKCSIFPNELRAPKMSYSAELFNLLNDLNNLTINDEKITVEEKKKVIEIINEKANITPKQLAKLLNCSVDEINGFRVNKNDEPILTEFKGYKKLLKVLEKTQPDFLLDKRFLDQIAEILTQSKGINERQEKIKAIQPAINQVALDELSQLSGFTGTHALSFKAIYIMNEELLNSEMNQMQILHLSNKFEFTKKAIKGNKIQLDSDAILSPVARQAIHEAIKVINQLRKEFGEFDSIVIETTRDKNSNEQKKNIKEKQKHFENENKKVIDLVGDKVKLNAKLKEKLRLYIDQDCKCAYTLEKIDLMLLLRDPTAYEVDHIIPISVSLDDSYNNKVLVTHKANQEKGNLTPVMAFRQNRLNSIDYASYKSNVLSLRSRRMISNKKCDYLLFEKDINKYEVMKSFINRNLVDTSYANRVILNACQNYFKSHSIPTKVFTVKGAATHQFRKRIKLDKDRDENFAHHGIDALIIASLIQQKTIHKVLNSIQLENGMITMEDTGEVIDILNDKEYFDDQYISLIQHLYKLDESNKEWNPFDDTKLTCQFSWKIDKKTNRQISDETIYSTRITEDGEKLVKKYKNIYDAKWYVLANDIMNDTYQNKYLMYLHDPQTFEKMIQIVHSYYDEFKSNTKMIGMKKGKIDFKFNPFYEYYQQHGKVTKYAKKNNGPEIDCLKYFDGKLGNHIDISHKYIANENNKKRVVLQQISPYRTDFYLDEGIYKFVTVRYCNIRYNKQEDKHIIDETWYQTQLKKKKISDQATFLFSMHRNECLELTSDKEVNLYRYTATNSDETNVIELKSIHCYDENRIKITIGKKIKCIKKYRTDAIGNLYEVKKEQLKLEF